MKAWRRWQIQWASALYKEEGYGDVLYRNGYMSDAYYTGTYWKQKREIESRGYCPCLNAATIE